MSLLSIDDNSWLVRNLALIKRTWSDKELPASEYTFKGRDNAYYTVSKAPNPLPPTKPLQKDSQIRVIKGGWEPTLGDCGFIPGVWEIGGGVFCKVISCYPSGATPESASLDWLNKQKLSFPIPKSLYYAVDPEDPSVSVIFTTRVPGVRLYSVWPNLSEMEKDYVVREVVKIHQELAGFTSNHLAGVDGLPTWDNGCFVPHGSQENECIANEEAAIEGARGLGMTTDIFYFSHLNMNQTNIMIRIDKAAKDDLAKAQSILTTCQRNR